ncbi:MAG: hypothetical protein ACI9LM_004013 [Alteromonadaceae bacterium]
MNKHNFTLSEPNRRLFFLPKRKLSLFDKFIYPLLIIALIVVLVIFWAVVPVPLILVVISLIVIFGSHLYANDGENAARNLLFLNMVIAIVSIAYLPTIEADDAMNKLISSGKPDTLLQEGIQYTCLKFPSTIICGDK